MHGLGFVAARRVRFRGGRAVFLLEQLLYQRLVGQRRAQIRLTFQSLFVRVQGRLQLTAFGQGIASIVVGVGIVAFCEPLGGAGIVCGFIERHALPLVVFEAPSGFGRALLLEQVYALLVGTQPQVDEVEGVARLRQRQ
ncbi:hypothetical protein D9M71_155540 [compost metagenome]